MSGTALNAKAFDMFCSIGGLSYGLQNAGITVSAGLDLDGSCRYAYEENCKANFIEADIRDISFSRLGRHIGNAVPPSLAAAIGRAIIRHLVQRE